jgi:HK97 family phage portal protein
VDNAYSSSWIAYSCIAKQARDIAGAPFKILRDPLDMDSAVKETDKLAKLLNKPHPNVTGNQLIQFIVTMLRLRGAFFLDFDNAISPTQIIPWRDPRNWKPIISDDIEAVVAWEYRRGSKHFKRMPSEVVVGKHIDPTDPYRWQSPLLAAADPLKIDRDGDHLNAKTISGGGQNGAIYATDKDLGNDKYDQLIHRLQNRQQGPGEPMRPLILSNGLTVVDPKFTQQDLRILEQQEKSAEKICAVYGMTPAILFKDDTPNRATFDTRMRIYWTETLIPIMDTITDALDTWTVPRYGLHFRFDLNAIPALRDDLLEQVNVGKILHSMHIPVSAINARLDLGLDEKLIPGADTALVPASLVPATAILDADYSAPTPQPAETEDKMPDKSRTATAPASFKLTNKIIRDRHKDAVGIINRGKARTAIEIRAEKAWRAQLVKWRGRLVKLAVAADGDAGAFRGETVGLSDDMGNDLVAAIAPMHRDAAVEGSLSILDLVSEERFYGTGRDDIFRKMPELPPEATISIRNRQNYIKDRWAKSFFKELLDAVTAAVLDEDGPTAVDIAGVVRRRFNTSINQANLIGRQEVGTAFNSSRFGQMRAQEINKHEWITSGDELVRGEDPKDVFSHVSSNGETRELGRDFPCGLDYPQEDGGEAGNVINCRCLTLPVVEN